MIENSAQFNVLFNMMVSSGDALRSQKESLERVWQAAWYLGCDVGYDLGHCDGASSELGNQYESSTFVDTYTEIL